MLIEKITGDNSKSSQSSLHNPSAAFKMFPIQINLLYKSSISHTVVWEKFTVGIFHVKNFMLKYFHLLG